MAYKGVKFETIIEKYEIPHHDKLEELKAWCRIFHEQKLAPSYPGGSYGNLSFRTKGNEFIITGTKIGLKDRLEDDCFVMVVGVELEKRLVRVYGTREPSSETLLHYAIYTARADVNAVFHGHALPDTKLNIPTTRKEAPYGSVGLVDLVLEILEHNSFIIMKNHGFISLNSSLEKTGSYCLEMLRKAKLQAGDSSSYNHQLPA